MYLGASRRVSQVTFPNGGKIVNSYDGGWSKTARAQNGAATTYTISNRNRLISAGGMACSFDIKGKLTNRVDATTDPKSYNYFYAAERDREVGPTLFSRQNSTLDLRSARH